MTESERSELTPPKGAPVRQKANLLRRDACASTMWEQLKLNKLLCGLRFTDPQGQLNGLRAPTSNGRDCRNRLAQAVDFSREVDPCTCKYERNG